MKCNKDHNCESCKNSRKMKLYKPCENCMHNQVFVVDVGKEKCCYKERISRNNND
jgi:hypothetical protein